MNLYLLTITDEYGDNEYDSFVICAENKNSALQMAIKETQG
jgi:hypothetical protein